MNHSPDRLDGVLCVLDAATPAQCRSMARALARDEASRPWIGSDVETLERWFLDETVHAFLVTEKSAGTDASPLGIITYEEQLDPDYFSANIDIALVAAGTDRGIGTDAVRTLAGWLFHERGHHRLTIDPAVGNARAIRAYEKVGFKPVGTMRRYERGDDGTWHDNLLMDMLAHELTAPEA